MTRLSVTGVEVSKTHGMVTADEIEGGQAKNLHIYVTVDMAAKIVQTMASDGEVIAVMDSAGMIYRVIAE